MRAQGCRVLGRVVWVPSRTGVGWTLKDGPACFGYGILGLDFGFH